MKKEITKLTHFLFRKRHSVIDNQTLFKSQKELSEFAVEVPECNFFGKKAKGIRPYISQQLQPVCSSNSKPIKNHYETYLEIVKARFKELNPKLADSDLSVSLEEFNSFFSKELLNHSTEISFDEISSETLEQLKIVAIANGGKLNKKEFMKAFINLKNPKSQ